MQMEFSGICLSWNTRRGNLPVCTKQKRCQNGNYTQPTTMPAVIFVYTVYMNYKLDYESKSYCKCAAKMQKELKVGDIYYASGPGYEFVLLLYLLITKSRL